MLRTSLNSTPTTRVELESHVSGHMSSSSVNVVAQIVLLDGAFLSIHNVEAMKFQDKHKEKCQLSANNFNVLLKEMNINKRKKVDCMTLLLGHMRGVNHNVTINELHELPTPTEICRDPTFSLRKPIKSGAEGTESKQQNLPWDVAPSIQTKTASYQKQNCGTLYNWFRSSRTSKVRSRRHRITKVITNSSCVKSFSNHKEINNPGTESSINKSNMSIIRVYALEPDGVRDPEPKL
ncbi:hypothetical protein HYC85_000342 [Camellia sinensis]|uniref:Uncharacterized protein n=1 Tax=Camellia sinensis TaxID=4442 RepID=A0A7J7I277_CAMSI|nr:hypothetical protein HYC85_000342 [Camellia sinensis]